MQLSLVTIILALTAGVCAQIRAQDAVRMDKRGMFFVMELMIGNIYPAHQYLEKRIDESIPVMSNGSFFEDKTDFRGGCGSL
jgi:hypothetical protein